MQARDLDRLIKYACKCNAFACHAKGQLPVDSGAPAEFTGVTESLVSQACQLGTTSCLKYCLPGESIPPHNDIADTVILGI